MASRIQLQGSWPIDLLKSSESSFFRTEALESYNAPSEVTKLRKFYSGELTAPVLDGNDEWFRLISEFAEKGRPVRRVRAVSRRLSPYVRCEMEWGFNQIAQFGEEFNVLIKEQHPDLKDAWDDEYYVIDDKRVVYLKYDDTNRLQCLEEETSSSEVARRIAHKYQLLESATPYRQFVAHQRTNGVFEIPDLPLARPDIHPAQ
jgi:hypothetical protein